ncbi:MAG: hypothetical protein LKF82_12750 [Acinetobacter populi]|jgi:hypothetical protein|uniref:hypothetical protein n=1 Tax=Acinetobacter populi TaxID=1582270 RepID=UPI0023573EED|nr:hypothetical protein [Acinetobacter populi]MCH4248675.1 hypothetical protein [Acinetobacter populi]
MKFRLSQLSELQIYRCTVFARCLLAIFAGFAIANLTVPLVAFFSFGQLAMATYSGLLLSFVIWLLYILYVFSARSLSRIVCFTLLVLIVQISLVALFKYWGNV